MVSGGIVDPDRLIEFVKESGPEKIFSRVLGLAEQNDLWRASCINLNAAEGVISPQARKALTSDLYARSMPSSQMKPHKGRQYYEQVEIMLNEMCTELFGAKYPDSKPATAATAEGVVIHALTEIGDSILCLEDTKGHRTWNSIVGYSGMRGLKIHEVPFDHEEWNVNVDGMTKVVSQLQRGTLLILGTPFSLFPIPCHKARRLADELGAKFWYDGAHVLGLIAGGQFQNPLKEGADILTGSTQKTLSGPVGGLTLTNDEEIYRRTEYYFPGHFSIFGHSRLVALAITLAEWMAFGKDFASQIVANAKTLATALDARGFDVIAKNKGFTETHMILVDVSKQGGGMHAANKLEAANLITSAVRLWRSDEDYTGLRLGVTEMTRYGMQEAEMKLIAELISETILQNRDLTKVRDEAVELRKEFDRVHYCFET